MCPQGGEVGGEGWGAEVALHVDGRAVGVWRVDQFRHVLEEHRLLPGPSQVLAPPDPLTRRVHPRRAWCVCTCTCICIRYAYV